jgi:phosphonate transport system substrate-binding protein
VATPATLRSAKTRRSLALLAIAALPFTAALSACGGSADVSNASSEKPSELVFAMPPGTEDGELGKETELIKGYIAEAAGVEVKKETPADYLGVVEAIRQGHVDVALTSPFATSLAVKNGSVDPLIVWKSPGDKPASHCYSSPGSGINTLEDVKGKKVAFVDPGSSTGYFMPKAMFVKAGLEDGKDYQSTFAGGHDSALLALTNHSVDVACSSIADRIIKAGAIKASDLQEIGATDPLPLGVSIVVNKGLDQETRTKIANELAEKMSGNTALTLLGGLSDYVIEPGADVYQPLYDVAEAAGVNLEDMR